MASPVVGYNTLSNERSNPFIRQESAPATDTENEETPQDTGIMIHVVPETSKNRWNHIEDLDSFFTRMYQYHQKHGFYVMMLQEVFELGQFIFVVSFTTYLLHCVDYKVLFRDDPTIVTKAKITISDVLLPTAECVDTLGGFTWIALSLTAVFWMFRLIKVIYHTIQYWDIKMFFNTALKVEDAELDNLTWHEVQKKIREVQQTQQMCIHKEQLTELDIYHRILRFKNYMVAMMNKNLVPAKVYFPIIGECVCLSRGLRYNIEFILFRGPWSPFENNWHLKEEYKRQNKRTELANKLSMQILWLAIANFLLCPLVFLWQLMYFFFSYGELIKREPGTLGARCWSQYGRLYLRHFNELDHELDARINRAYTPACRYMNSFSSPLMAVIAKNVTFICGGVLIVLLLLTIYDEDVVQVEHVITVISVLSGIVVAARVFIPDENLIYCPEDLLIKVLAHVHYLPVSWRGLAHTSKVREQFGQFFQFRAIYLLNELLSPLITPFALLWSFRPRALDLVDFFRNFTVSVVGVGDVCSFAQMDVRKHGNPDWQLNQSNEDDDKDDLSPNCDTNQYTQGEHGKTELSLVHFTLTNPQWKMPVEARQFVQRIKKHAIQDLNRQRTFGGVVNPTAMAQSLYSIESMGGEYSSIIQSVLQPNHLTNSQMGLSLFNPPQQFGVPTATINQSNQQQQQQQQQSRHSFDFERMLQQNLTDGSTAPLRSTILHDINEDDDDSNGHDENLFSGGQSSSQVNWNVRSVVTPRSSVNMSKSLRGGMSRREGPTDGPQDSLLHSLRGPSSTIDNLPVEFTAADMCLSTLYLHELHHRHIRRRGTKLNEQSQRHEWSRPHQQDNTTTSLHAASTSSTANKAAEKTPLLGTKKS